MQKWPWALRLELAADSWSVNIVQTYFNVIHLHKFINREQSRYYFIFVWDKAVITSVFKTRLPIVATEFLQPLPLGSEKHQDKNLFTYHSVFLNSFKFSIVSWCPLLL